MLRRTANDDVEVACSRKAGEASALCSAGHKKSQKPVHKGVVGTEKAALDPAQLGPTGSGTQCQNCSAARDLIVLRPRDVVRHEVEPLLGPQTCGA